MVTQPFRATVACPHCGDMAPRVKRTLRDRIVSWFTPVKRYRCDYCDWTETFAAAHTPANEVPGSAAEQASPPSACGRVSKPAATPAAAASGDQENP